MTSQNTKHQQFVRLKSGLQLCYAEYGATNGIPILYFHGWPSSRLQGKSLDSLGAELGFTIYALDRPGIGWSDHQPDRTLAMWPALANEFLDLLNLKGQSVHLLGISGGGPYALATACALPERIASTSVVCGAPPLAELKDKSGMNPMYQVLLKLRPALPVLIKPLMPIAKWIASKTYDEPPLSWFVKTLSPADQKVFLEDDTTVFALHSFREAFANNAPGLICDADAYSEPWNLDYSRITGPVHFWHGTTDQNIPFAMAQHLAGQIPQVITHWLEGEGHYSVPMKYSRNILEALRVKAPEA